MALVADALVSEAEARAYLDVGDTDKPTTALLEQVINGLSERIIQRTGRTYINSDDKDAASTREFRFSTLDAEAFIDDCREITLVEVTATPKDADSWLALADDEWAAEPFQGPVVNKLRFLVEEVMPAQGSGWGALSLHATTPPPSVDTMRTPWPRENRALERAYTVARVTAKWGFGADLTTVPANVKLALCMWLENIYKRDKAFFSETIGVASALTKMPADVAELLDGEEDTSGPGIGAV